MRLPFIIVNLNRIVIIWLKHVLLENFSGSKRDN